MKTRMTSAALGAALLLATPAAAYTHKFYAWTTDSAECPTTSGNMFSMDDVISSWSEEMVDEGWPRAGRLIDGDIDLDRFCDPDSSVSGCSDSSNGIDETDAVMVGLHGKDSGDHWEGLLRDQGTSGTTCAANASNDLRAGDYDLEFLHMISCHSMDDDNLPYAWEMMQDPDDSPSSGLRLQVLMGFHGDGSIGTDLVGEYRQVANDGFNGAVSDAWMDNLYESGLEYDDIAGTWEVCPIAYSIGSTESGCESRLLTSGYGSLSSDPPSDAWYCYTYFEDCLPLGDDVFTPL